MSVLASVVVPTYRRNQLLRRCLHALLGQDLDPTLFEIIVVDDAASPETRLLCEEMRRGREISNGTRPMPGAGSGRAEMPVGDGARVGLRSSLKVQAWDADENVDPVSDSLTDLLHEGTAQLPNDSHPCLRYIPAPEHRGPAAARNLGWQAAAGEIIAFTDDDCVPTPGWLRAGLAAFQDGIVAVSGRLIMPLPPVPTDYELNAAAIQDAEFVTANCFYRRQTLADLDGFDERFTQAWREDSDLLFRLLDAIDRPNRQKRIAHAPDAIVIHPVRPAPWGISLKQQSKNMYNALLYQKHPAQYQERVGSVRPYKYYAIVAALIVTITAWSLGSLEIALGAGLVWLGLTAWFCFKRLQRTSHAPRHVAEMIVTSILIPPLALYWRARGALKFKQWFV